ncbi:hypothetical protein B0H13DRAFT_1858355 [Mycena leptocephala]|nr:hypothetical protein B0H13DRAFT_1858355 [Mycena leptocephala]
MGAELPPSVLTHIGRFTETLQKIHTFVEAQQNGSRLKNFFHQGEMSKLLKDCRTGLQQGLENFQVPMVNHMKDITQMQKDAQKRHREVLDMIEALSDTTSSDGRSILLMNAAQISGLYSGSHNSSNSISMLPSQPKIFHRRDSELSNILQLFSAGTPRIAVLGAGGMGKTSLAKAVIHHTEITQRYNQHRFFVACDVAAIQVELAALIGAHVGLKPGRDITHPVIQYFSSSSDSLLILDNLETLWEPAESRGNIGVPVIAHWCGSFGFVDIADNTHNPEEVDKVLSLTDNMPLAISLIAHLVDSEGCSHNIQLGPVDFAVLVKSRPNPHSKDLLSLLSMLPDGLSDVELVQSKLPLDNILGCKAALICTSLAYSDEHKRLKALVPIREYMQKIQPPGDHLIRPLLKHFQELLDSTWNIREISPVLPHLFEYHQTTQTYRIFSQRIGQGPISLIQQIQNVLPCPRDHRLEAYFIVELLNSRMYSISNLETLASNALEYFKEFDDPDLKCGFYNSLATYYQLAGDISSATKFCEAAISVALSIGNTTRHSQGLRNHAWIE